MLFNFWWKEGVEGGFGGVLFFLGFFIILLWLFYLFEFNFLLFCILVSANYLHEIVIKMNN
jgi:hypothetical protein